LYDGRRRPAIRHLPETAGIYPDLPGISGRSGTDFRQAEEKQAEIRGFCCKDGGGGRIRMPQDDCNKMRYFT